MSPAVIRRIMMEIKHQREMLNLDAQWAEHYKVERIEMVRDTFDRVAFWRGVLNDAQQRLSES